jgi:tetratricopeptide (TPR) repeat protein
MSRIRFIFAFVFCLVMIAKPNELLKKAETAYDAKEYKKAIETYEELVKQGYSSDKLFYNLGNSYYRNNQLGKAIFNYERARKINPNDQDIRNNLNIAYAKTIDKIESKENFFVGVVKTNVLTTFSTTAWAWLSVVCFFILFIGVYIFIANDSVGIKRTFFFVSLVALIGFFIVYSLGYSAKKARETNDFAVITAPETKVFIEPTAASASKFGLHEGTKVRIIDLNGDWILIKLENGNEGWIKTMDAGIF